MALTLKFKNKEVQYDIISDSFKIVNFASQGIDASLEYIYSININCILWNEIYDIQNGFNDKKTRQAMRKENIEKIEFIKQNHLAILKKIKKIHKLRVERNAKPIIRENGNCFLTYLKITGK